MTESDGSRYEVDDDFLFVGRTFTEYRRMFDLAPEALADRRVLDCGAGPGAFAAVAAELGAAVTAVDPMYELSPDELAPVASGAVERTADQLREKRDLFVWDYYGDPETRVRFQRAAFERFLADYALHPERYVEGTLPGLPFADDAFDLALSANLLFLYDDRLDEAFHVDALRELARVAGEVRVFPLHALDAERSRLVEPVVHRLRADGLDAEFRTVPYEFQPGATEALTLRE